MLGKKRIKLYTVIRGDDVSSFLTLVTNKDDAFEYAKQLLKIDNYNLFQIWTNNQELDPKDPKVWDQYFDKFMTEEDLKRYSIVQISYSLENIAMLLRMFIMAAPLGCSFESPEEHQYILDHIEAQSKLESLKASFNDLVNQKAAEAGTAEDQIKEMENDETSESPDEC